MNPIWIFTDLLIIITSINIRVCDEGIILVHVLFRHGHRTPDKNSIYPNDPYKNESYYPYGLGELTNEGKLHEFKLGQYLRKRYNSFLDDVYTPDVIDSRSTNVNRTKMSLELVLASLFPPNREQTWLSDLNWQPIPYNYWPLNNDEVLMGMNCPSYRRHLSEYMSTKEYQDKFSEYREVFQYIEENSGLSNITFYDALDLYFCLETESIWGFQLPEWTKSIYPDMLTKIGIDTYEILSATVPLKKLTSGYLLKKIINDSTAKLSDALIPQMRKIFLYSAHEVNIAFFIHILGFNVDKIPSFGSAIMVELHQVNGIYGFKIFHEDNLEDEPILLNLPNCGQFCPIHKFIELYQQYFPDISFCYNSK